MSEWIKPGAEAAILGSSHGKPYGSITRTTIKTVGKRDIVLDNGDRFNRARPIKHPGGQWSTATCELMAADDPRVTEMRAANRIQNRKVAARNLADDLARVIRDDDWPRAKQLAGDLAEVLAHLEVEAMLRRIEARG